MLSCIPTKHLVLFGFGMMTHVVLNTLSARRDAHGRCVRQHY